MVKRRMLLACDMDGLVGQGTLTLLLAELLAS